MAELVKRIETDILSTLRTFEVGESKFIPISESKTSVRTWDSRWRTLTRDVESMKGTLYKFRDMKNPNGVLILRVQ